MWTILGYGFACIRLAAAVVIIWWALDWRSPFMASIRIWALAGFVLIPLGVIAVEIVNLRRGSDSLVDQRRGWFRFGVPPLGGPSFKEERPPKGGTPNPPIRRFVGQAVRSC